MQNNKNIMYKGLLLICLNIFFKYKIIDSVIEILTLENTQTKPGIK